MNPEVGQNIYVRHGNWIETNSKIYEGTITAVDDDTYTVCFGDFTDGAHELRFVRQGNKAQSDVSYEAFTTLGDIKAKESRANLRKAVLWGLDVGDWDVLTEFQWKSILTILEKGSRLRHVDK
ncbi:MAG: hypothetical protein LBR82_06985 [Desulfovibrio sp.]|nr:hypothetical protein [Desulfovibrio sp.]